MKTLLESMIDLAEREEVHTALSTVYLCLCGLQDLRRRRISLFLSAGTGAAALLLCTVSVLDRKESLPLLAAGLTPGVLLLLLSSASQEAGAGDGICFFILGILLNPQRIWILFAVSLLFTAAGGAILMLVRQAGRRTHLPFLTFAAAAWACMLLAGSIGIEW